MKKLLKIILIVVLVVVVIGAAGVGLLLHQIKQATQVDYQTYTASDGAEIKYTEIGQGVPIIFVHGFGGNSAGNLGIMQKLEGQFRCISFDQRGFGETTGTENAGITRSAQDILDLMDFLGLEKATLFGYSMGSQVVLSYLEQFGTDRVEKVVLGDITPKIINDDEWNLGLYQGWYTQADFEKDLELIPTDYEFFYLRLGSQMMFPMAPETIRDLTLTKEELFAQTAEQANMKQEDLQNLIALMTGGEHSAEQLKVYAQYWKTLCEGDYRDLLPSISVPVGILYADPGSIYFPKTAEYMAEQIPNATLIPMANSTHTALIENFSEGILSFLVNR